MFGKKVCNNCGEKIGSKSNFCPECGYPIKGDLKDSGYGMLGKNDFPGMDGMNNLPNSMFGGLSGKIVGKMLGNAMKMLEKEMEKNIRATKGQNSFNGTPSNFELYINGKKVSPDKIKISNSPKVVQKNLDKSSQNLFFSKEKKDAFLNLEKVVPKTSLKRLSDRVVYEVFLSGVESLEDISLVKLESSVEIKAVAKDKAYKKIIPVGMTLDNYYLKNGILILEMIDSQNL